ncbi:MAG: hypothetical protein H7346_06945 [Burkholderiaceae bacterium]|nr:hypothetical protein [Burkholderiaceae bacterium]
MRPPLMIVALLCGLAAAVTLLVWRGRGGDRPQEALPMPVTAAASASAAVPVLGPPLPVAASRVPVVAAAASPSAASAPMAKPSLPAASPVRSAFALSSDHQALIHDTVLAAADHEQLEREPRDDAWATEAERLIRQELARNARAGNFDVITVDCRQTLCAIQAFSYGESGYREWVKAVDELYRQTLVNLFDSVNTAFPNQGSRSPVLTFLHRKAAVGKP